MTNLTLFSQKSSKKTTFYLFETNAGINKIAFVALCATTKEVKICLTQYD